MKRKSVSAKSTRATSAIAACVAAGLLAAVATLSVPTPASAEGFFESLFNGIRRAVSAPPRQETREFTNPVTSLFDALNRPPDRVVDSASGPAKAFCVRTCDGHFFPVRAHAGLSAGEACRSFCPASETRLYSGSNIDYAMAADGSRYANLPNAFAYRKQLVPGCTCNGRTVFGLAHIDATTDPTLRPGDLVVTENAILAFTGAQGDRTTAFTPVENFRGLTVAERARLADTKIMQTAPAASDTTASIPPQDGSARRAQLDR